MSLLPFPEVAESLIMLVFATDPIAGDLVVSVPIPELEGVPVILLLGVTVSAGSFRYRLVCLSRPETVRCRSCQ